MYNSGLILLILQNLHKIDFEGKKDAVQVLPKIKKSELFKNLFKKINFFFDSKPHFRPHIYKVFNNILRRQIGTRTPTVEYICTKPEILFTLCRG